MNNDLRYPIATSIALGLCKTLIVKSIDSYLAQVLNLQELSLV